MSDIVISWLTSLHPSPSLAEGFVQIRLDGVKEVCSIDIVLVQLDTEKKRGEKAEEKTQYPVLQNKQSANIFCF